MAKRALVLRGGTMRGAFLVGSMTKIHELLGPNYFDAIFATSVGVFEQAYFAVGRPDIPESIWRNRVHGNQLINFSNLLFGKPLLDLDYLIKLFQSKEYLLNIDLLSKSQTRLSTFVTNYKTKTPEIMDLRHGPVFDIMRATSAIPFFYPKHILINGERYVDSWVLKEEDFQKFIDENLKKYDEVLIVSAYSYDKMLAGLKNVIKPSKTFLWHALDTNRYRLIKTIEQGKLDTEKYILENNF